MKADCMNAMMSVKVTATQKWSVAEKILARLRKAGLHPLDLSLSTPLVPLGKKATYPIEVPADEANVARQVVNSSDL